MRGPALATAWAIWRRHRWGLSAIVLYLLGLAIIFAFLPPGPNTMIAGMMLTMPFLAGFHYLLAVFSYGYEADLASLESGFPARMFSLPVRTIDLVRWPMLYGTLMAAVLWITLVLLVLRPCAQPGELTVALWWPALMFAA